MNRAEKIRRKKAIADRKDRAERPTEDLTYGDQLVRLLDGIKNRAQLERRYY